MPFEIHAPSGSLIPGVSKPVNILEIGAPGMPTELIVHDGKFYIYDSEGDTLIEGGLITTKALQANTITAEKLVKGLQAFVCTLEFTAISGTQAKRSVGSIKFYDGTEYLFGSEGYYNMSTAYSKYYVYHNADAFNPYITYFTTSYLETIGSGKTLLACIEPQTVGKCKITVYRGTGTYISGDQIITGEMDASIVNVVNINASNIISGVLGAHLIGGGFLVLGPTDLWQMDVQYSLNCQY